MANRWWQFQHLICHKLPFPPIFAVLSGMYRSSACLHNGHSIILSILVTLLQVQDLIAPIVACRGLVLQYKASWSESIGSTRPPSSPS
nr:hypothetical protein [Candidatus Sigynarchaeota archaeon]